MKEENDTLGCSVSLPIPFITPPSGDIGPTFSDNNIFVKKSFQTIDAHQAIEALEKPETLDVSSTVMVDCRYREEQDSGKVVGAVCVGRMKDVEMLYSMYSEKSVALVFYCNRSLIRSSMVIQAFRQCDRISKRHNNMLFNNIYLLEGGIEGIFEKNPDAIMGKVVFESDHQFVHDGSHHNSVRNFQKQFNVLQTTKRLNSLTLIKISGSKRFPSRQCFSAPLFVENIMMENDTQENA